MKKQRIHMYDVYCFINNMNNSDDWDEFASYLEFILSHDLDCEREANSDKEPEKTRAPSDTEKNQNSISKTKKKKKKKDQCNHPVTFASMCSKCGERVKRKSGVRFAHIHTKLRLNQEEVTRLRNKNMIDLLRNNKLILVLDLDHTLLNTTKIKRLTLQESYLRNQAHSLEDVSNGSLFQVNGLKSTMMTKLRPFVRQFLKEAKELFEMYVFTMGTRPYAMDMTKLLDPKGEYFDNRIIAKDAAKHNRKGLGLVLGQPNVVLILDDTQHVWEGHKENLILMDRYHFFASSCRRFNFEAKQSLSERKWDESEEDGVLANVLNVLKKIHSMFFKELSDASVDRDVRLMLNDVRKEVLKGCNIFFSASKEEYERFKKCKQQWGVSVNESKLFYIRKLAQTLGANCAREIDWSVTHVVSTNSRRRSAVWAVGQKRFLVHPRWIEAAYFLWKKLPEENFPVN